MKILTKQDLYDILYGCTILGTGGGGSIEYGLKIIDKALEMGKEFKLVSMDEIPDDEWIGVPYMCGALTPDTGDNPLKDLKVLDEPMPLLAFKAMEDFLGKEFYGVLSTELGGGNTAEALYVAAMLGRVIVDADPAGRSVPELQHSTFYINDIPIYPMAVADAYGDTAIITNTINDNRAEDIVRSIAVVSNNSVGVLDHPQKAKNLRGKLIHGAISYALEIGAALRVAKENKTDAVDGIIKAGKGKLLFTGTIEDFKWESKAGFTFGDIIIKGNGEYSNHTYKVWFKNENIISWLDEEIHVTVPDLICILDSDTNEPVQNPFAEVGMNVKVFALPAPEAWTTPRGLKCFGPKHFGYDIEYKPII